MCFLKCLACDPRLPSADSFLVAAAVSSSEFTQIQATDVQCYSCCCSGTPVLPAPAFDNPYRYHYVAGRLQPVRIVSLCDDSILRSGSSVSGAAALDRIAQLYFVSPPVVCRISHDSSLFVADNLMAFCFFPASDCSFVCLAAGFTANREQFCGGVVPFTGRPEYYYCSSTYDIKGKLRKGAVKRPSSIGICCSKPCSL